VPASHPHPHPRTVQRCAMRCTELLDVILVSVVSLLRPWCGVATLYGQVDGTWVLSGTTQRYLSVDQRVRSATQQQPRTVGGGSHGGGGGGHEGGRDGDLCVHCTHAQQRQPHPRAHRPAAAHGGSGAQARSSRLLPPTGSATRRTCAPPPPPPPPARAQCSLRHLDTAAEPSADPQLSPQWQSPPQPLEAAAPDHRHIGAVQEYTELLARAQPQTIQSLDPLPSSAWLT
jgi:hypothetical protein